MINPTDDLPGVESGQCDCCSEPWAWEAERRYGPRLLRLCEDHADRWLRGERDLFAEIETVAGRALPMSSFFGLASALDGRRNPKRSA